MWLMRVPLLIAIAVAVLGLTVCSSGQIDWPRDGGQGSGSDGGTVVTGSSDATTSASDASDFEGPQIVYGESPTALYQLDPDTNAVTVIGPFVGCTQVLDLALDEDSTMYVTTPFGLYTVDTSTAHCTLVASGALYPNSLSFVPAGTVDPNFEALVGYQGATYVRIDLKTGALTPIGQITGGYSSSGDIVSVKGGGTYLTVKGPTCPTDCLFRVDPKTGDKLQDYGPTGYVDVFGLAFWAGKLYGFTNGGQLFRIDIKNGMTTTAIPIPDAGSSLEFWGAGSTTAAPLGPQ
jgi:hypothetical protein